MKYKSSKLQQVEQLNKMSFIQSLKRQVNQHKKRQHKSFSLESQIGNIQSKFQLLRGEKDRILSQNKMKLEINQKQITDLKAQSDALRMQIHLSIIKIQDILRAISTMARSCESSQSQITALMTVNQSQSYKNRKSEEENRNIGARIQSIKLQRYKLNKESERLTKQIQGNINLLKILEKESFASEASKSKLKSILQVAQKENKELQQQVKSRKQVMIEAYTKLDGINQQVDDLIQKINNLRSQLVKGEKDLLSVMQNQQITVVMNEEQANKIVNFENRLREIENDYDSAIMEKEALEMERQAFSDQNKKLSSQVDQILHSIIDADKQTHLLQQQLDNYLSSDQEARKQLNRREKSLRILEQVQKRFTQTGSNIVHLR